MHGNQSESVLYAYLAGVFDGEGCIQIERSCRSQEKDRCNRRVVHVYTLSVQMTNLEVLQLFEKTFGGSIGERTFSPGVNRSAIHRWRVTSRPHTLRVLQALLPYLIVKRKQAVFMIEVITAWRGYKGGKKLHRIPEEEMKRREESYVIMRKFNAVGERATTEREDAERRSDSLNWLETTREELKCSSACQ